jgi:hypothetical protein
MGHVADVLPPVSSLLHTQHRRVPPLRGGPSLWCARMDGHGRTRLWYICGGRCATRHACCCSMGPQETCMCYAGAAACERQGVHMYACCAVEARFRRLQVLLGQRQSIPACVAHQLSSGGRPPFLSSASAYLPCEACVAFRLSGPCSDAGPGGSKPAELVSCSLLCNSVGVCFLLLIHCIYLSCKGRVSNLLGSRIRRRQDRES